MEALTDFTFMSGAVEFAEVSLLSPAQLDALQPANFSLATITFTALASGTSSLSFLEATVDDAFGNKIPEPGTLVLLCIGVFGLVGYRLRRDGPCTGASSNGNLVCVIRKSLSMTALLLLLFEHLDTNLAYAQSSVTNAGVGAEVSVDGGITWTPLVAGAIINPSNRLRAPAGTVVQLMRTTGCMNRYSARWLLGGAVVHYAARFSSPATILFPGDYWEITDQDFATVEGSFCAGTDHCGVISPFAAIVPTETSSQQETSYTVSHDSGGGCTVVTNEPTSFSPVATWALIGPQPAAQVNSLAPGQAGIYHSDGSFSPFLTCDANGDGVIDLQDISAIFAARNTPTTRCDPRDADGDGIITVNDARICFLRVTTCTLKKNSDGTGTLKGTGFDKGMQAGKIKNNTRGVEQSIGMVDVGNDGTFSVALTKGVMDLLKVEVGDSVTITVGSKSCDTKVTDP
jgi:hypothetical protein